MNRTEHELELMQRYLEGIASHEETRELESLIVSDAGIRQDFLRYAHLDSALAGIRREQPARAKVRPAWHFMRPLAAAAAVLLLGLVAWEMWEHRSRGTSTATVATVLFSEGCEWRDGRTLADGQPLSGGALKLKRGMAVVRFAGGAEMVLSGETDVNLQSRDSVKVSRGHITVRVNEESVGFKVHTPASELTDLGTEFEVKVGADGETELQVLEGAVSYAKAGVHAANAPQIAAGKAVRFAALSQASPKEIAFDARPFAELLRSADMEPRANKLLAYEPFDYPEAVVPLEQATRGQGWAGNWQLAPLANLSAGDLGDLHMATDRLHGPWMVQGGRRGMLEVNGRFGSRMRKLAQSVRLDRDGIYYMSMMVRWEVPVDQIKSKAWRFLRLGLRSSTNYSGDRVLLTLPGFLRPQVETGDGFKFMSPAHVRPNEAQLWCAKIIARADGEDEVSFRIYGETETLDFGEPAYWHIASRGSSSDAVLDTMVLAAGGVGTAWFDEIRIATSWREVMPPRLSTP